MAGRSCTRRLTMPLQKEPKLQVAGSFVERKSEPGGGGNYNIYQHPTDPDLELVLMHGA